MVNCICGHEEITQSPGLDSPNFWNHWEQLSKRQTNALNSLTKATLDGLQRLSQSLLTTEADSIFSPCTLYCALLCLSATCNGASQEEILTAIACEKGHEQTALEAVREGITGDSGLSLCSMASSMWMSDHILFKGKAIQELCESFHTDAFIGSMASDEMDSAMQKWINDNTGNLLKQQTRAIKTTTNTAMEMITTLHFKAKWFHEFWDRNTTRGDFYLNENDTVRCSYMVGTEDTDCYISDNFIAVEKSLEFGYSMWFLLPNPGVTLAKLRTDSETIAFLTSPSTFPCEEYRVTFRIPRFDVCAKMDIRSAMHKMGIHSIFDVATADFSKISDDNRLFLGKAEHAARIQITEEGVEAAAFVDFGCVAAGIPPELKKLEFSLDRPFLFAISKRGKVPLYIGTVTDPSQKVW